MTATASRSWPLTDLAHRAAAGDELAFARLARQLDGLLKSISRRFYGPGLDDDDLHQEARIALLSAVKSWNGSTPFTGFVAFVVERRLSTAIITAKRGKHRNLNESICLDLPLGPGDSRTLAEHVPDVTSDPADVFEARETLRLLAEPGWLTPLEAGALAICVAHPRRDNAYAIAAERLGVTRKSIDNALQRARRKTITRLAA